MAKDIPQAVREVCLAFPESFEKLSHGSPDFCVGKKTFATFTVNHHGDGRISLWLAAPPGAQEMYSQAEPEYYFVPPYVGTRGWLGVELDKGLGWGDVAERVREAYSQVAPKSLVQAIGKTIRIKPPTKTIDPEEFDPLSIPAAQAKLARLQEYCLGLPEVVTGTQFGDPVFKAGKKTFVSVHRHKRVMQLSFWVGVDAQPMLTLDKRYTVPHYTGHNGWIMLNIEKSVDWDEVEERLLDSYRHFALKRMLKAAGLD